MTTFALTAAFALLGLGALLSLVRLLRGPTPLDRLLAFDMVNGIVVALIALLAIARAEVYFLEAILLFSIFGFLSTATIVFYLDVAVSSRGGPEGPHGGSTSAEIIDPADSGDERYDT